MNALSDVVVLDTTTEFWASMAAAMMADFGAHVIRVEPLPHREACATDDEQARASLYELANRNKRSIALKYTQPAGRAALEALVGKADVFVTDWPRAQLDEAKLDYRTLAALKPDLIYARGSALGPQSPDRDELALDELAAARTGLMPVLPQPGQPPVYTGAGQMYTSVMIAFGVMVALEHRAATGEGQEVDASLFAGNIYGASLDIQAFLAMGGERFLHPVSRLDAGNPMSGTLYPTQDGLWVTLTMPDTDRWWPGLSEIVGLDVADARFDSHEKRCEMNRLELIGELEAAFLKQPAAHWRTLFTERQMSADVIEGYAYPAQDAQALRNRFVIDLARADGGMTKSLGFPIYMSDSVARLRNAAPYAGQHSAEVLSELGYAEDTIVQLEADGVAG